MNNTVSKGLAALMIACCAVPMLFIAVGWAAWLAGGMDGGGGRTPSDDIPPAARALYREAAARFSIPWEVLAAVGWAECDHGRDRRCSRPNEAGAEGPMQFLPATFARWSWASGSADPTPYDQRDAVFAAAAKLAADGVDTDPDAALFSYNHSDLYVMQVEWAAESYGWERPEPEPGRYRPGAPA